MGNDGHDERRSRGVFLSLAAAALVLAGGTARSETPPQASAARARAPEIEAAVRALVHDRSLKDAQIGVVVMDVENGNVLAQSGEHVVMNPASNAKLYTAAAALALLQGSHRYSTTLSGSVK